MAKYLNLPESQISSILHCLFSVRRAFVGYGFNDVHMNDRIDEAMILNQNLKLNISLYDYLSKLPHCIERHNCNNRIKLSYGFGTPEWFYLQTTGNQNHPEKQKIEAFRKLKNKN